MGTCGVFFSFVGAARRLMCSEAPGGGKRRKAGGEKETGAGDVGHGCARLEEFHMSSLQSPWSLEGELHNRGHLL